MAYEWHQCGNRVSNIGAIPAVLFVGMRQRTMPRRRLRDGFEEGRSCRCFYVLAQILDHAGKSFDLEGDQG